MARLAPNTRELLEFTDFFKITMPTYDEAKEALADIHRELLGLNRSAASSLMEGLEEALTLHHLGVFDELGRSLKTTNAIESLNSQLSKYLRKVKHWTHSDQRQRWVAMGILEAENKMRRIQHWERLPMLRTALEENIKQTASTAKRVFSYSVRR